MENEKKYKVDGKSGVWRTVSGRRIFIEDGQDLDEAMAKSGKFDKERKANKEYAKKRNASRSKEDVVRELMKKSGEVEPAITADVKDIIEGTKGQSAGLEFRLKTEKSLSRKVDADMKEKNLTADEIAGAIYDNVRYTYTAEPDDLYDVYNHTVQEFEKRGYEVVRVKNTLHLTDVDYRGLNTVIRTPDGYLFEMQYHTPESFEFKNGIGHKLYEKSRDITLSAEERAQAHDEEMRMSNALATPRDIDKIESFNKIKKK